MCKRLSLLIFSIMVLLAMAVSGCITINVGAPATTPTPAPTATAIPTQVQIPTPTPTPEPTATPMPTPTPVPVDNIIGLWEIYYNSIYGYYDFFENGTIKYNEGGHFLSGVWSKIDNTHYIVDIGKGGPKEIILNDEMTQFHINGSKLIFTKKPVP